MKQSEVKPGVRALLSLGRRGAVAVRVLCAWGTGREWLAVDSSGREHTVTARQLRPLPVTDASGELIGYAGPAEPGQTIDAGDVVITTTLHRLG
jgi:hypothetical protein